MENGKITMLRKTVSLVLCIALVASSVLSPCAEDDIETETILLEQGCSEDDGLEETELSIAEYSEEIVQTTDSFTEEDIFEDEIIFEDGIYYMASPSGAGPIRMKGKRDFKWPVPSTHGLSSCFKDGRNHDALDISGAAYNADVVASYDGKVIEAYDSGSGYGKCVLIEHSNYQLSDGSKITLYSKYNHLASIAVSANQKVVRGQKIGGVGDTGGNYPVHLDYQIMTGANWHNYNYHNISIDPFANEILELPSNIRVASTADCCGVGPTACCCKQYLDYVKNLYKTPTNRTPIGYHDAAAGGNGTFYVKGWAFDPDKTSASLSVHIYLGGGAGAATAEKHMITAAERRDDVLGPHPSAGNMHGFKTTFDTAKTGTQTVYIYAINIDSKGNGGGDNPLLTNSPKTISIALPTKDNLPPSDTMTYGGHKYERFDKAMTWENAKAFCESKGGHLVTITSAAENEAVRAFAAKGSKYFYAMGGTDKGSNGTWRWINGEPFTYANWDVQSSPQEGINPDEDYVYLIAKDNPPNKQSGEWIDSPNDYEKNANYDYYHQMYSGFICEYDDAVAPTISNVQYTRDEDGYTVTCEVSDNVGVTHVEFPTWTAINDQDDLDQRWWDPSASKSKGSISGNKVTFRVNRSDHGNEMGLYKTDIYAYDAANNQASYGSILVFYGDPMRVIDQTAYGTSTYYLISNPNLWKWQYGNDYGKIYGGYLATISSAGENAAIQQMLDKNSIEKAYIGGTDNNHEGDWTWINGEPWIYENWGEAQPDNYNSYENGQNFLAMWRDGTWDDYWRDPACSGTVKAFVIEVPFSSETFVPTFDSSAHYSITDVDASIRTWVSNPFGNALGEVGFYFGSNQDHLNKYTLGTGVNGARFSLDVYVNDHVGNLQPGGTYYYQFYAVTQSGQEYTSSIKNFTTKPVLRTVSASIMANPDGTAEHNGHTYYRYDGAVEYWEEALRACETVGGHLVTITTAEEQAAISELVEGGTAQSYWIGGTDRTTEGTWKWITGEAWNYSNWNASQPDNWEEMEDYLMVYRNPAGKWNDAKNYEAVDNATARGFICEVEAPITYQITYEMDGGINPESNPTEFTSGQKLTLEDPAKEHNSFSGWAILTDKGFEPFENGKAYDRDLSLYANWEKTIYQITLDVNHEVSPSDLEGWIWEVTYGDPFGELPVPEWEGHTFGGWYTDPTEGEQIFETDVYTEETTLYAHWKMNTVHVTFDGGEEWGGMVKNSSLDIEPGQPYGSLPVIALSKYNFLGWYTEKEGGEAVSRQTTVTIQEDHVLYARWEEKEYVLSFNANMEGVENPASRSIKFGEVIGELPICEKEGYVFAGWFESATSTRRYTEDTIYTSGNSRTLVAHWEEAQEDHVHSYSSEQTQTPTCTEPGVMTFTCEECGDVYTEEVPATGHTPADAISNAVEATCAEDGYTGDIICQNCGEVLEEGTAIPATGHLHTVVRDAKDATCQESGYTGDVWCLDCEQMLEEGSIIEKLLHTWNEGEISKELTCSEEGEIVYTCSECGENRTEIIPVEGHLGKSMVRFAKAATCTADGYTGDTYCLKCYELIQEGQAVPATGHLHTVLRDAKEATCTQEGYTGDTYCLDCEEMIDEGTVIEPSGHDWIAGTVIKDADCTEEGEQEYTCDICQERKTESIPPTGHVHTSVRDQKAATCAEEGYTGDTYCIDCEELIQKGDKIPKTEHSWDDGVVTKEATATEKGIRTYTCKECGGTKTEEIPSTGQPEPSVPTPAAPIPEETDAWGNKPVSEQQMDQSIQGLTNDNDPANSSFSLLQARVKKATKSAITISWKRVSGATSYTVYGSKCGRGNRYQKLATVRTGKFVYKGLKKGTYYKLMVVAIGNGRVKAVSKTLHVATSGGKVGNNKAVKITSKTSVTLKKGKTTKIKARAVAKSSALKVKKHRRLSYETTNPSVATVNKNGKVKAVGKGTCVIYVYSQDGFFAKVKIKVK